MMQTAFPTETYPQQQPQPQPQPQQRPQREVVKPTTNELQEGLSLEQLRVPSFQDFQAAIELQIASLSEIQAASKRLQALSQSCPTIDECEEAKAEKEVDVEEYCDSGSEDSDYDSYDGDADWRDEEDGSESDDSMTDPESVRSECSSPVEEKMEDACDFGLRPLVSLITGPIAMEDCC